VTEFAAVTELAAATPMSGGPGQQAPAGDWRMGEVVQIAHPRPDAVVVRLHIPDRVDHLPGQHYVIRLTADDGYRAQRSYSVASAPADPLVEFYIEQLPDGEVSGFLADGLTVGEQLAVRGPIGGWFVWDGQSNALAVGGGTGVVPLVAMLRHARDVGTAHLLQVVAAARTLGELPYAAELVDGRAVLALSREDRSDRPAGRLVGADLGQPDRGLPVYVCGSTGFAETASRLLVDLGVDPAGIRVERFGPSG